MELLRRSRGQPATRTRTTLLRTVTLSTQAMTRVVVCLATLPARAAIRSACIPVLLAILVLFASSVRAVAAGKASTPSTFSPDASAAARDGATGQVEAVRGLIRRHLGQQVADEFELVINTSEFHGDAFAYHVPTNASSSFRVRVAASNGVSLARGVYSYLTRECGAQWTWFGKQFRTVQSPIPVPHLGHHSRSPFQRRVYFNVVTFSYSTVWWDWNRWEQELDWMALHGINTPLAFVGQEAIWLRVYHELGISSNHLGDFFAGPSFQAWQRLGNIQGFGGPVPRQFFKKQERLQLKILERMREFGMTPVFPAFAGHVAPAFVKKYPHVNVSRSSDWAHFGDSQGRVWSIEPTDPMFQVVASMFVKLQAEVYGRLPHERLYSADMYNEMQPRSADPDYLRAASKAVLDGIQAVDQDAVWLLQTWTFSFDKWWRQHPERIEHYLSGVPKEHLILIDLNADMQDPPAWQWSNFFNGRSVIWGLLHNFGGNSGMNGAMFRMLPGPWEALRHVNSTLVGMAIAPEGLEQNPMIYEFASDIAWADHPFGKFTWLDAFIQRRYPASNTTDTSVDPWSMARHAWHQMLVTVYDNRSRGRDGCHKRQLSSLTDRPWLYNGTVGEKPPPHTCRLWYGSSSLWNAWRLLTLSQQSGMLFSDSPGLIYDIVDVGRQTLSDLSLGYHAVVTRAYLKRDTVTLTAAGQEMQSLVVDSARLLACSPGHDRLDQWLEDARRMADGVPEAEVLYEMNARNQLTLWGPNGNIHDYASKQWAGIVNELCTRRWRLFLRSLLEAVVEGRPLDIKMYEAAALDLERSWSLETVADAPSTRDEQSCMDPAGLSIALMRKHGAAARVIFKDPNLLVP